jgi:hypothetical protein
MSKTNKAVIEGSVLAIGELQTFSSGFTKRVLVVKTNDDKYPQEIPIEFVKERTAKLDSLAIGDGVMVETDIRGNEYNGKWYVSLTGWRLEREGGREAAPAPAAAPAVGPSDADPEDEDDSSIPF